MCLELLKKTIIKNEQTSDWGADKLTSKQLDYAAKDVLYLHDLKEKLDDILIRENRMKIAEACFKFLEHRVNLDLSGWSDIDIFKH